MIAIKNIKKNRIFHDFFPRQTQLDEDKWTTREKFENLPVERNEWDQDHELKCRLGIRGQSLSLYFRRPLTNHISSKVGRARIAPYRPLADRDAAREKTTFRRGPWIKHRDISSSRRLSPVEKVLKIRWFFGHARNSRTCLFFAWDLWVAGRSIRLCFIISFMTIDNYSYIV